MHSIAVVSSGYQLSEEVLSRTAVQIERLDELTASMIDDIVA